MQIKADIVMKPVNEIIPYWRNPRRNDKTVDALVEEISKMGFNVPIVVDKNNVVVKGHARLKAAKRLQMEQVPCIVSDAPEDVIRADRIADNKIQELSSWDFGKLNTELVSIKDAMNFKKLFFKEEVERMPIDEMPQTGGFKPVGLEFWDGGYEGEPVDETPKTGDFEVDDVIPVGHQHPDVPVYADLGAELQQETPKQRSLKTLCPYCGKVVVVNV